jgi:hypothetical protein
VNTHIPWAIAIEPDVCTLQQMCHLLHQTAVVDGYSDKIIRTHRISPYVDCYRTAYRFIILAECIKQGIDPAPAVDPGYL